MPRANIFLTDPATGEDVPMSELARRYRLTPNVIRKRSLQGDTGWRLVRPSLGGTRRPSRRVDIFRPHTPDERRALAAEMLARPAIHALAMPLIRRSA